MILQIVSLNKKYMNVMLTKKHNLKKLNFQNTYILYYEREYLQKLKCLEKLLSHLIRFLNKSLQNVAWKGRYLR